MAGVVVGQGNAPYIITHVTSELCVTFCCVDTRNLFSYWQFGQGRHQSPQKTPNSGCAWATICPSAMPHIERATSVDIIITIYYIYYVKQTISCRRCSTNMQLLNLPSKGFGVGASVSSWHTHLHNVCRVQLSAHLSIKWNYNLIR